MGVEPEIVFRHRFCLPQSDGKEPVMRRDVQSSRIRCAFHSDNLLHGYVCEYAPGALVPGSPPLADGLSRGLMRHTSHKPHATRHTPQIHRRLQHVLGTASPAAARTLLPGCLPTRTHCACMQPSMVDDKLSVDGRRMPHGNEGALVSSINNEWRQGSLGMLD